VRTKINYQRQALLADSKANAEKDFRKSLVNEAMAQRRDHGLTSE